MRRLRQTLTHRSISPLTLTLICAVASITGCSSGDGGGSGPTEYGAIKGIVRLPFKFATANEPIEGATVRVSKGDFDTTTTTDANGQFVLGPIPAGGAVAVTTTLGTCLTDNRPAVSIPANDTARLDISLASSADFDTIPVDHPGAMRMEIEPSGNRAILLVSAAPAAGGAPVIMVVDLATGQSQSLPLTDLTDVYDLAVIGPNLVVFSFLAPEGYCLRFFDPVAMLKSGGDVLYLPEQTIHPGKIALDTEHSRVFVTHGVRQGTQVTGHVWAVDITQRALIDADDSPFDGTFSFDNNVVEGALGWPYGIGFDAATSEILVANRQSRFVTAINWGFWGNWERSSGQAVPTEGVRKIPIVPMSDDSIGFGVEVWGFAGAYGVAAKTLSGSAPILRYTSGGSAADLMYTETAIRPASLNHTLKVIPERQSWFSMFRDPDRQNAGRQYAIEERSTSTLRRLYRYESRFFNDPTPTAFGIDQSRGLLYVAYGTNSKIEVFCLP